MSKTRMMLVWACLLLVACATTPLGRKQLRLFPEAEMEQMGLSAYQEMKKNTPLASDEKTVAYVRCVAKAVTGAITGEYAGRDWEINVFKDDTANAFALPGGKIGVHTGLLKVAKTQDQLAAVLGHEVAHVLSSHGNERVSTQFATQTGLQLIALMGAAESSQDRRMLMGLLGVGAQVGILLPYSRLQESEADMLGLDLMARAGFDPHESVTLWQNMSADGGRQPPQFLSTHPSHESRIRDLSARTPEAVQLYEAARRSGQQPHCQ